MAPETRLIVLGGVGIVLFDVLASLVARALGLEYAYFAFGSFIIYMLLGARAFRVTASLRRSTFAGAIAGLVEGTLGWVASWLIGPGRPPDSDGTGPGVLLMGTLTAVAVSAIGAQIGARVERRRSPSTVSPSS